jgi:peptide/nickel transport system permease protein
MLIPIMLGVMLIVFIFQAISPDDPARLLAGSTATDEQIEALHVKFGLDKPIPVQYANYVGNLVLHGSLGVSYTTGQPVLTEIMQHWPFTIALAIGAVLIGILLGIPLGILSAVKQYTWVDSAILGFTVFISSFPNFWIALLLIIAFAVNLGWLPANGLATWKGWILPAVCIMIPTMAGLIRTTRSSMLETIRQDYVRTARAKGLDEKRVIWRHVVRNSMIPVINNIGMIFGMQLGGVIIIEQVFGVPGLGQYIITAVTNRNYPSLLGSVVIIAFCFAVINLVVDLSYTLIDPKLKITFSHQGASGRIRRLDKKVREEAGAY